MKAGTLRHRVMIQTRTESQDRFGGNKVAWADYKNWYASIEPLQGREFFNNQQMSGEITHRVRMRYCSFLTNKHRIKFGSRYFDIEAVLNLNERNIETHAMCKEAKQ